MKVTVLGCGGSGGVPLLNGDWGVCNSLDPRNRRRRPSVLVQEGETRLLIDFGPDLREQFLENRVTGVEAVFLTHVHADHCHGIDDLRRLFWSNGQKPIPVYASAESQELLLSRFPYAFMPFSYGDNPRPPLTLSPIFSGGTSRIGPLNVESFAQDHTSLTTYGFRIGDFAYSSDVKRLSDSAFEALAGVKVWLVDCVGWEEHSTNSHFAQTLDWIARIRPERAYLTHMGPTLDYETVLARCPPGVCPAHDGLVIEV